MKHDFRRFTGNRRKSSKSVHPPRPPRTIPPRPSKEGRGEIVKPSAFLGPTTTPEIVQILHTLRVGPEIVSCAALQAGQEGRVPTRHPSRQARRKAGTWAPRLPCGASVRIGKGGGPGRRGWTRHRGSEAEGAPHGKPDGKAMCQPGTTAARRAGRWGHGGRACRVAHPAGLGKVAARLDAPQGRSAAGSGEDALSLPPPLVGSFLQGPATQVRARAPLLSRDSKTKKTHQPRAKFDRNQNMSSNRKHGRAAAKDALCAHREHNADKEKSRRSTRQGSNRTGKSSADIGGISGILSAPRFSIIGGRCGSEITCGDGCAWVPFPQILKGIFGSSSPMTMHRNQIGRIVCGGVLCAPRTTRIRSGPFVE